MKKVLNCPCGWTASADSDDDLVRQVQTHAKERRTRTVPRRDIVDGAAGVSGRAEANRRRGAGSE